MDGLIGILILIGIFSSFSKSKKKKAQKQAAKGQVSVMKSQKTVGQTKIPFTKEEWNDYLADMKQPDRSKAAKAPEPMLLSDHDEPEGTVSTQGESTEEHAGHHQKILAEEARMQEVQETLQELRHMNRQKLRQAVVMNEVLGKPVSLRPRGYR